MFLIIIKKDHNYENDVVITTDIVKKFCYSEKQVNNIKIERGNENGEKHVLLSV